MMERLVPVAQRLAGAVRDYDQAAVDDAFADAAEITGDRLAGARALAVIAAAMVPVDEPPSQLLGWVEHASEYHRLIDAGVAPHIARQLADWSPSEVA